MGIRCFFLGHEYDRIGESEILEIRSLGTSWKRKGKHKRKISRTRRTTGYYMVCKHCGKIINKKKGNETYN